MAREPPSPNSLTKVAALANPELGAKQICPSCSTKFYDLGRRPAACPKCGTEFDPEEALRSRRVRVRGAAPEEEAEPAPAEPAAELDEGFEAEPDEAPELDAEVDDPPLSADEDEAEPDAAVPPAGEALGVDFSDEDLEEAEDDEVPFIEDEDDTFPEDEIDGLPAEPRGEDR